MNAQDVLKTNHATSTMVLKSYVSDLTDAELMSRPGPGCNHIAWQLGHLIASECHLLETVVPVASNQIEFSLTAHDVMYNGTLDDCMAKKRMAMSCSPLGSFFKKDHAQAVRIRKVVEPLLEKYEATADQLLLPWILMHPSRIYPVIGTTKKERLKASVDALQINLELEDWFILLKASQGHEVT